MNISTVRGFGEMNKQVLVSDSDSGNLHYTMLCVSLCERNLLTFLNFN